jgi:hypothetical protein
MALVPIQLNETPIANREVLGYSTQSIDLSRNGYNYTINSLTGLDIERFITLNSLTVALVLRDYTQNSLSIGSLQGDAISQEKFFRAINSIDVSAGEGFTVVADILDSDIATAPTGPNGPQQINAKLYLNGVETDIESFQWQQPTGKIGGSLNAILAAKTLVGVPETATVDFDIIVKTPAGDRVYKAMINGKMVGRDHNIKFVGGESPRPVDEVTIAAVERINDSLELAPRKPVIMFDPSKIDPETLDIRDTSSFIVDSGGRPIIPILEPVGGLNLHTALRRAYTSSGGYAHMTPLERAASARVGGRISSIDTDQIGVGMGGVVTNIQNFPISRVDFSISGTWHSGIGFALSPFDPVIFTRGTTFHIMDIDQYLPAGSNPPIITADDHYALGEIKPPLPNKNAVLVTYEYRHGEWNEGEEAEEGSIIETTVNETTVDESGDVFDESYTKVTTTTTFVEVTNSLDPQTILSTFELYRTVNTIGNIDIDGILTQKLIHSEVMSTYYLGDLIIGYGKTVYGLITVGSSSGGSVSASVTVGDRDGGFEYQSIDTAPSPVLKPVQTENNVIWWIDDPLNPGNKIQLYNITRTQGLIYRSSEPETVTNPITGGEMEIYRKWPALVAQASGVVDEDGTFEWGALSTTREDLIRIHRNQSKVSVRVIDHLNGTIKTSFTSGKVQSGQGGDGNSVDETGLRTRTMLLRHTGSETSIGPRVPDSINIPGLRKFDALALGNRILARQQTAPVVQPVDLTGFNFSARRGSVFRVADRDGVLRGAYVTGLSVTGTNLGRDGHNIQMSLDTVKLLTR